MRQTQDGIAFIYQPAPLWGREPARCYGCDGVYEGRALAWYHDPSMGAGYVGVCPYCQGDPGARKPPACYYAPVAPPV